ncbi:CBS domain-containing protein [Natronocella acetinitrilica]|uniref:CBS domain-containing protein n=1 Tax=Natronocella acetinitrilica TaxID=414046 RepID=A0AAE3G9M2_9GAMM|nr:CBS domain-containing protein [Natronocella acetinitrilica]MCP1677053.1 CBS domain-containing protein [Natronocella acetinitrilica]
MSIGEHCTRDVVIVVGEESLRTAAQLMRQHHVGALVVIDERDGERFPVGVVTDRDLVVEVIAAEVDADTVAVRDLVTGPPTLAYDTDSLADVLQVMRQRAVRRLPVVNDAGMLVGIITVDDAIGIAAEMLADLSAVVDRQRIREAHQRP